MRFSVVSVISHWRPDYFIICSVICQQLFLFFWKTTKLCLSEKQFFLTAQLGYHRRPCMSTTFFIFIYIFSWHKQDSFTFFLITGQVILILLLLQTKSSSMKKYISIDLLVWSHIFHYHIQIFVCKSSYYFRIPSIRL